jgi:MFS family permease
LAALVAFILVERRVAAPLIDVRLYRDRLFAVGNLILFFVNGSFFGIGFLMPQLLQSVRGLDPLASGLTTFPTAIGIILVAPLVGRLYPVVGPRRLVLAGAALAACAAFALRRVGLATDLWQIRLQMLPLGVAFGLVFISLQSASFARIDAALTGRATAAYNAVRQVATSCGFAVLATVLAARLTTYGGALGDPTRRDGAVAAFHDAFLAAALLDVLALGAATLLSDRLAAATMRGAAVKAADGETAIGMPVLVAE